MRPVLDAGMRSWIVRFDVRPDLRFGLCGLRAARWRFFLHLGPGL